MDAFEFWRSGCDSLLGIHYCSLDIKPSLKSMTHDRLKNRNNQEFAPNLFARGDFGLKIKTKKKKWKEKKSNKCLDLPPGNLKVGHVYLAKLGINKNKYLLKADSWFLLIPNNWRGNVMARQVTADGIILLTLKDNSTGAVVECKH